MAARPQAAEGFERRLLTIKQAAEYMAISVASLYSKVYRREIPFVKIGRSVRFDVRALDEFINRKRVAPQER